MKQSWILARSEKQPGISQMSVDLAVGDPARSSCTYWTRAECPCPGDRLAKQGRFLAPARWCEELVIPSTTSVSTFSPVRRSRVKRKTCAQPGQSEPRSSPSDAVTSIDRFSTRLCPLSTSEARSISAWHRAAWRGKGWPRARQRAPRCPGPASAGSPSPAGHHHLLLRSRSVPPSPRAHLSGSTLIEVFHC